MECFYVKQGWVLNPNPKIVESIVKRIKLNNGKRKQNTSSYTET